MRLYKDSDVQYEVCGLQQEIDKFLYERNTIYLDPDAAKLFDNIDIVFAEADSRLVPWSPAGAKVPEAPQLPYTSAR